RSRRRGAGVCAADSRGKAGILRGRRRRLMTQELDVESAGDAAHHVLMMDLRFGLMAVLTITATVHAGSPIPYPHPQITEVLFNVPSGAKGDANGDGERDATGDEFIEIANP